MARTTRGVPVLAAGVGIMLLSLAGEGRLARAVSQAAAPSILLIQADDLGYGDLGSYGQSRFETPHLDRLAREGTRFTSYYAGSTVCAPSRASLMTGRHTGHASIRGNGEFPLEAATVTLGTVLQAQGYRTAVIGKWGLGNADTTGRPDRQGFAHAFGILDHRHAHRQYTTQLWRNDRYVDVPPDRYVNDLFTEDAIRFVSAEAAAPFFLYLNYTVPHAELQVPDEAMTRFAGRFVETPFLNPPADKRTAAPPWNSPSLGYRSQRTPRAAFAAMVERLDQHVGEVLSALKAAGRDESTLVLFTSDNGPHREGGADPAFFNSSGGLRGIKRDLHEGGIRVPMLVRWTGRTPAGRVSAHAWAHWDLLPTLATIAGGAAPANIDGLSMAALLDGKEKPAQRHDALYWEFHERGFDQAVRMGRWKGVRRGGSAGTLELYDIETDPSETRDVAAAHPEVVSRVTAWLSTARTASERWPVTQ